MSEKKKLSASLKYFFGIGDFGFNLMTNVENYYFQFFLTNVAAFSVGLAGVISTIYTIVDAALSWIYGAILNGIRPKKWGRYRSWLILLPWIVPFLYAFQFIRISDNPVLSAVIILTATISSHIVWNFPYVANVSMINVAASTPDDKIQLSATRGAWNNLASVAFSYLGLPFATILGGIVGENNRFGALAFVMGVVMVAGYFAHFKMLDGYEEIESEEDSAAKKAAAAASKMSAGEMAGALFSNAPLLALLLVDLAKWMMKFVVGGAAIYYFTYVARDTGLMATYLLISNILGIVGAYMSKSLAKKLSTRTTMIITFVTTAACMLVAFVLRENVLAAVALMCVAQLGYGVAYSGTPALYADAVVYSDWKMKKNATGLIMGLQNLPLKVANLVKAVVITACLAAVHFDAQIDPAAATGALKAGVCLPFMVVPAVALIIGALLLIFCFRLTKEDVVRYQAEIDRRA